MDNLNNVLRVLKLYNVNTCTQIPAVGTMTNKPENTSTSKTKINTSFFKLKCGHILNYISQLD